MTTTDAHQTAHADTSDAVSALLLDHAVGALSPAERLVVDTHLAMRAPSRELAHAADVAGGALLDWIEPVAMTTACLQRGRSKGRKAARRSDDTCIERIALAINAPDALRWGWIAPGIRRHKLPKTGSALLRVAAGRHAPRHDHEGQELTLVLRGSLIDEVGCHGAGDIVFAGPGHSHAPFAGAGEDCVCLISMSGAWRLSDWTQRLAARVFAS
jgi:putative transcriptional regulator